MSTGYLCTSGDRIFPNGNLQFIIYGDNLRTKIAYCFFERGLNIGKGFLNWFSA